jgi:hypothetical protein
MGNWVLNRSVIPGAKRQHLNSKVFFAISSNDLHWSTKWEKLGGGMGVVVRLAVCPCRNSVHLSILQTDFALKGTVFSSTLQRWSACTYSLLGNRCAGPLPPQKIEKRKT